MKERKKTPNVPGSERNEKSKKWKINVESKMCKLWNNKNQICKEESSLSGETKGKGAFKLNVPSGLQPGKVQTLGAQLVDLRSGLLLGAQSTLPASMRNRELMLLILLRFIKIILQYWQLFWIFIS